MQEDIFVSLTLPYIMSPFENFWSNSKSSQKESQSLTFLLLLLLMS